MRGSKYNKVRRKVDYEKIWNQTADSRCGKFYDRNTGNGSASVDSLEENKAAAQSEVSSLQSQLTELLTKAGELEEDLIAKGEEIIEAKEDLKAAEEKEEQQYEDMKLRINILYEKGDASMLVSLIESDSFADLVNKAEYIQNVHTYDRKMLDEYVEQPGRLII